MLFRMTRSIKHEAQGIGKLTPFNLSDIHNISDISLEALLVSIQEEQIKRHLIHNKSKKLKLTINDIKVKSNNIHLAFEGIDTIIISDIYVWFSPHSRGNSINWISLVKYWQVLWIVDTWAIHPNRKEISGGDSEYLLQILDKLDPDKVCSYWEVLQRLSKAVNCGEKYGDGNVKEWVEKNLDNMSDSDDEKTDKYM